MSLVVDISAPAPQVVGEDLTLVANGSEFGGWSEISVTLSAEAFPNSFDISVSSRDPVTGVASIVKPGDAVQVKLGKAVAITGYVDRVSNGGAAESHQLRIAGRGKCQDLVDCSAEWEGSQISGETALGIAVKLAAAYKIDVRLAEGASAGPVLPQFNLTYGETAADIIQRCAHASGLLAYEDANGTLVLTIAGTTAAASGAVYGENVEAWSTDLSMNERFSDIVCTSASQDVLADAGDEAFFFGHETDPNVPRHRLRYMTLEQVANDARAFTETKALWEVARRAGRATSVRVTVDSWHDSSGLLWAPNTLIPIAVPGLPAGASPLCIAEVTFTKGEAGTHADLALLPPAAFAPEPVSLQPVNIVDAAEVAQ